MTVPPMERVTLRGGPLNGLPRHVLRGASEQRFKPPLGDSLHLYRRDGRGVWRHAGATP